MPEVKLTAETRTEFGKGAARRIRRADKVPAVLYGHGTDPIHITLPGHETLLALRQANALLSIEVDGGSQLALPKQVQRDPIKHTIEHVDLVLVRRGEKVTVDIPVLIEGEAAADTLVDVVARHRLRSRPRPPTSRSRSSSRSRACGRHPDPGARPQAARRLRARGDDETLIVNITRPDRGRGWRPSWPRPRPRPASSRPIAEGTEDDAAEGEGAEALRRVLTHVIRLAGGRAR